jgi:hypothetical protein
MITNQSAKLVALTVGQSLPGRLSQAAREHAVDIESFREHAARAGNGRLGGAARVKPLRARGADLG